MGRVATGLVVGLVVIVVGAAVVDSFRGDDKVDERPPGEAARALAADVESRAAIANRLRHERISGRLLYTDERCVLRAVTLPDLAPAPAPRGRRTSCGFAASPDGRRAATNGVEWRADSRRVALCRGGTIALAVGSEHARPTRVIPGCIPAWRPDGVLTLVRDGTVVDASGASIVSARAIRAAARRHIVAPDPPQLEIGSEVVDLAWPTPARVALLLRLSFVSAGREFEPEMQVAVFERGTLVGTEDAFFGEPWTRLEARRGLVAVRPGTLLDADARRLYPQAGIVTGRADAVAISPDGRWVAVGLRGRVTILSVRALRAGRVRSVTLPFAAKDVAWR